MVSSERLGKAVVCSALSLGLSPNHSAVTESAEYPARSVLGSGAGFSFSLGHMTRPLTISRASGSRPLLPP